MTIERISRRIFVGGRFDATLAADVVLPDPDVISSPAVVFFCVPGGGLNRGYYDLRVEGDSTFSFATQMAARGMITVAIDPLGVGESTRPEAGFELTPDDVADAIARACEVVQGELRIGTLTKRPLEDLIAIGVAHSVGGMLAVLTQARHRTFDALALLGFGTSGMPQALSEEAKAFAGDPEGVRANLERLARAWQSDPYFNLVSDGRAREVYGGGADRRALEALRRVRTHLPVTVSLFVLIPGSVAPEAASIDVPVFLAAGAHDMCGPPHELPASFPACDDVTLLRLAGTGHTHFVFPSARRLFERLADWAGMRVRSSSEIGR